MDVLSNGSTIELFFEDGTSATGTLLVGADGANSTVRSELFPKDVGKSQQIPYGGINMHLCYHDAKIARFIRDSFTPIQAIGVHPKGYWLWMSIQDVPDPDKPENWIFQLQWTWKIGPDTASLAGLELDALKKEASAVFGEPYRTAWTNIPKDTRMPANRISVWHPQPIPDEAYDGRVVLVGDAAHAMSFHRGQVLNHGIADACKLIEVLTAVKEGTKTQKEAVLEYEGEIIKRAGEEVNVSKMNTEMMHDWPRLQDSPFMQRGGDKNK